MISSRSSAAVADAAWQGDGAVVSEHVAIERVERRVVDVGLQDAFAEIVEHHGASTAAQAAEGLLVEFGPDARAGLEGEQAHGLAAVAEGENKHAGAAVTARVRIADHRPAAVIDLGLFARRRDDDSAGLGHRVAA